MSDLAGQAILALNAGSSSLKFALFEQGRGPWLRGSVSGLGTDHVEFTAQNDAGLSIANERWSPADPLTPMEHLVEWIEGHLGSIALVAAGHRIVHGGTRFSAPVIIDAGVIAELEALIPLAPLHQPQSLMPIYALAAFRPGLMQVACFDTAFHHRLEAPFARFPLPRELEQEGLRRYGFHGLSYEYIAKVLDDRGDLAPGERVIVCHLGSGASLCAMIDGESVDTTMGFTALDGVMMGTRPGSLDPGLLLYLMREKGYDADGLEDMLYHKCGLLGVSGLSSDVRELQNSSDPAAHAALDMFAYSVSGHIALLASSLGGLDRLIFTGGIGEHSASVRHRIVKRLGWMGASLQGEANKQGQSPLSADHSQIFIEIIPTDEEAVIVRHTAQLYR